MSDELQAENARLKRQLDRALALLAFAGGVASGYSRNIEQTDPQWAERWANYGSRWSEAGGVDYEPRGAPISEATYTAYIAEINALTDLDPDLGSAEGTRLLRMLDACERYEAMQTLVDLNDE